MKDRGFNNKRGGGGAEEEEEEEADGRENFNERSGLSRFLHAYVVRRDDQNDKIKQQQ